MALTVEDGTGLAAADSYVSIADAQTYAASRGLDFTSSPDDDMEAALRRATAWIDGYYRHRFPGSRLNGRDQSLEWPRDDATDVAGATVANDEVPIEIVHATIEAAVRELATPGTLFPDLDRGGAIKSLRAGSVGIEYFGSAPAETLFTIIDGILSGLIGSRSMGLVGTAARA